MADLAGRHRQHAANAEARVLDVLRSGRWIGGPVVTEAEGAATRLFERTAAVGVASGTDALMLALQQAGVRPGDVVAVPALTFFATAGSVCALQARLVVVDVDERGLMTDETLAAAGPVDAVVPVHLFGNACLAASEHPCVVDDAAQAAGCKTPAGRLTAVSTYPTKTWSGLGDGGFVLGSPDDVEAVRRLGNHGAVEAHHHVATQGWVGRNSRLDPVSAAVLLAQAESFAERRLRRRLLAERYDDALRNHSATPLPRDVECAVPTYCLRTPDRARLQAHLADHGIQTAVYYPRPLHRQPALAAFITSAHVPMAERLCEELLAVPVHAGLSDADVDVIVEALRTA